MSDRLYVGKNAKTIKESPSFSGYSRVVIIVGNDNDGNQIVYEAGDETGATLEVTNPWGTQQIANDMLSRIQGYEYKPFTANSAFIDPSAEIGDGISIGDTYSVIASQNIRFGALFASDIEAPDSGDLEHELPDYISSEKREFNRKLAETRASINIAIDGITMEVVNEPNGRYSRIVLKDKDGIEIATTEKITLGGEVIFVDDLQDGTTVISGSNILTGSISADRINLTGAITWDDLTSAVQTRINSAGVDLPSYIKSTYIDSTTIRSPTIEGNLINLYGGTFNVKDASGQTSYGYIGRGTGLAGTTQTEGVVMSYGGYSGLGSGDFYIICTNAGVRLQAGSNALYLTNNGIRKVIDGNDTELGAAVFL